MEKYDKIRKSIWLSPEAIKSCENGMKIDNSKYLNEYVENALSYYSAYLSTKDNKDIVSQIFVNVFESKLSLTEERLSKLLFKLAVEQAKLSNVLAYISEVDDETLDKLHKKCVDEVKNTNGKISFEDTFKYQKGMK